MKAITLHQPWASLIALGIKTIETRTHRRFKSLVGERIAIHAAMRYDEYACLEVRRYWTGENRDTWACYLSELIEKGDVAEPEWDYGISDKINSELIPRGAVVAIAEVVEARWLAKKHDSDASLIDCWAVKRFGLVLENIERLKPPVPAKGRQGIWNWNRD